jgi:2-polyprenyl-3-methyl-5-hydroxy-6-metoxy-1,4-benzoquinol methylase
MDKNAEAVLTFNKHAAAYNERFGKLDLYNDTYELFSALIPLRYSSILDVGCGPGNITNHLLRRRPDLKITGVDLAPNMIAIARENNPKAEFHVMDCRQISALKEKYDAIVCGFTIPYLDKEEVGKLITDCASLIKEEGVLYFSLIEGKYENSGYQFASNGVDRSYVYYYNSVKILSLLEQCNLQLVQNMDFTWKNNSGEVETHLVFIARK